MQWKPVDATNACVRENSAGIAYEEFSCLYPAYGKTYFDFEIQADIPYWRDGMLARPWIPLVAVALYGLWMISGQAYFRNRPAWNCRSSMALWNVSLSLFSLAGMLRVVPQLLHNWYYYTPRQNFCMDPEASFGSGSTGLWVNLFILSKIPELIDTFFIIIHKKKLLFLHWYHHISVLLYCWHSYVTKSPPGILFCAMNYAVHGIMYGYYALMALRCKPAFFRAIYITILQISQMVVGVGATLYGWYVLKTTKEPCWLDQENNLAATIMYGSYLALFCQFFVGRYAQRRKKVD